MAVVARNGDIIAVIQCTQLYEKFTVNLILGYEHVYFWCKVGELNMGVYKDQLNGARLQWSFVAKFLVPDVAADLALFSENGRVPTMENLVK